MAPRPYQFKPLRSDEIRVLQLERAEHPEDPLRCRMQTLKIEDDREREQKTKLPYATLSYTWGRTSLDGSHLTHVLYCDGYALRITASLDRGLRRIRAMDPDWWNGFYDYDSDDRFQKITPPLLWVDQACIDQAHLDERNHEVSRMASIYKRSACLIIWLGEADDDAGERYRKAITRHVRGTEPKSLLEIRKKSTIDHSRLPWAYEYGDDERSSIFAELFAHPWFSRRWCVPEVVNTIDAVQFMLIGKTILLPSEVRRGAYVVASIQDGRAEALYQPDKHSLRYLLQEFDVAQCTLEHDIVYSLLQLAKDAVCYALEVDYAKPFEDVCRDIMKGALHPSAGGQEHAFQLLVVAASRRGARSSAPQLPSWIPDWRVPVAYTCDEHKLATEVYAYLDYSVSSSYLRVEGDRAFLRGELIKPCFPPQHLDTYSERSSNCLSCAYWQNDYQDWSQPLESLLSNTTISRKMLFVPSFPRSAELWKQLDGEEVVFIISETKIPGGIDQTPVYALQSCFKSKRRIDPSDANRNSWICFG